MKQALALLLVCSTTLLSCNIGDRFETEVPSIRYEETWPPLPDVEQYTELVESSLNRYREQGIDYSRRLQKYTPLNDYLNYSTTKFYTERHFRFDEQGLPLRRYGTEYHYTPVIIAEFGLTQYGRYLASGDQNFLDLFNHAARKLLEMQDEIGALRYPFEWRYYLTGEMYPVGWVSGMAQGQALSVYARAYYLFGDDTFLEAGEKALEFMLTPVEEGGTLATLADLHPSLDGYLIVEEYIATPASYTLNGFMFSLLGLYDWWQVNPKQRVGSHARAAEAFNAMIRTLVKILPYYDIGGFSAYDLGYITHQRELPHIGLLYHAVHIYQLHALASIVEDSYLKNQLTYIERIWRSYVD